MCLHLAGTEPPKGPQIHPSQSRLVTQKEEETPTTSPPMPGKEGSTTQGACSDPPMPMETGQVGDGRSWVEQAEASANEEWRRGRPTKHHRSTSRKWEGWSTSPFPLQDNKGRHEAVQIHPSQSHLVTQKVEETPTISPPMLGKEGSMTQGARSDPPMPMETGQAGDGQSWVEQAEASANEEWRRGRPTKHHWSMSRKWEGQSTNPFPLQDNEGRHEVVQQQVHSHRPITMWLPREWPAITLIWGWAKQRASTTRSSA